MNPRYVWPVCIAAAVHGGLLFGFPKSTRPAPSRPEEILFCGRLAMPPPEEELLALVPDEPPALPSVPERAALPQPDVAPSVERDPRVAITRPDVATPSMGEWPLVEVPALRGPIGEGHGPGRAGVAWSDSLDRSPRTRLQTAPLYPAEARRDGRSGTVTVEFVVNEAGEVITPRITHSSDRVFEEAALRAVAKWRFEPGRRNGQIVRFRMAVPIHFSLNE